MKRNKQLKAFILLLSIYLINLTVLSSQNTSRVVFQYTGADQIFDSTPVIDQCPVDTSVCQTNNTVEYNVVTNTIPAPVFTYSFSGATYVEAGTAGTGSGSAFNVGITNVVVTATNEYGSAICSFNVEVTNATWYADADNDGFGNASNSIENCSQPPGYVANSDDCDDNDATVYPGAVEICDGKDNNCNGMVDDEVKLKVIYYIDADGDGYGHGNFKTGTQISVPCGDTPPVGYVPNNDDCNDNDSAVHPGAAELCNGKDDNCDGNIDEGLPAIYYPDADHDGYGDATASPQGCPTEYTGGGEPPAPPSAPIPYVTDHSDCNDNDATVHPGAPEICDGKDNNCNGLIDDGVRTTYYRDADNDGYGDAGNSVQNCSQPAGYVTNNTDCKDNDASIHPGAPEICDGKDNDCNGLIDDGVKITYYRDADGDGYGNIAKTRLACTKPSGYVTNNTDCKDNNANINPGKAEICGNNIDDNCNGQIDEGCPLISVAPQPASVNEGNKGKTNLTFVVSLSAPAITNCAVNYRTVAGTATAGTDYTSVSGTLSFAKGQASKTVVVKITGDTKPEANETFNLELLNPVKLVISQSKAVGTIINDDGAFVAKQTKPNDPKNTGWQSGSSKLEEDIMLRLYPSPAKDAVYLSFSESLNEKGSIVIYNAVGQAVLMLNNQTLNAKLSIDISNLHNGAYLVAVITTEKRMTAKLIVQK